MVWVMLGTKNKKLGFTLIETIIALGFLTLIAMFLLPALSKLNENSKKFKDQAKIVYALQAAIEEEKSSLDRSYGSKLVNINSYDIYIDRQSYRENLDYIKASFEGFELEVIEVVDEKTWFYTN